MVVDFGGVQVGVSVGRVRRGGSKGGRMGEEG